MCVSQTRNSAIADKRRDVFRGQSRSPNMVPFDMVIVIVIVIVIIVIVG